MTTVVMDETSYRLPKYMGWRWLIGFGIGAVIAGPICLLLNEAVLSVRASVVFGSFVFKESEPFGQLMIFATRYGPIVYLPFMWMHALNTWLLTRKRRDHVGWSLLSGGALSIPIAAFVMWAAQKATFQQFGWISLQLLVLMYLPFIVTGMMVGLLHWRIAIWPLRQWRLRMESSKAAIRAME